jgi:hypothetical protein
MFNLQDNKDKMLLTMGLCETLIAHIHIEVPKNSNNWEDVNIVGAEKPNLETALQAFNNFKLKSLLSNIRHERNILLSETDFYALVDNNMSLEMKNYRQALRDITKDLTTWEKAENVDFPIKPQQ